MLETSLPDENPTPTPEKEVDELEEYLAEPVHPAWTEGQKGLLLYWQARSMTAPNLARMQRQYHGRPAASGGVERLFTAAGAQHDAFRKRTEEGSLQISMKAAKNDKLPDLSAFV